MDEDKLIEYFEQMLALYDDALTEEIEKLCPMCLYLFLKYVTKNPNIFMNRRISIPLYKYARIYFAYFYLYSTNTEHDTTEDDYYE